MKLSTSPRSMTILLLTMAWCVLGSSLALAQPRPKVSAAIDATALVPGKAARVAVVIDVPRGHHAQSNTPLDENFIKCEVKLDPAPAGIVYGDPVYPKGELKEYPALGKLSVYEGRVVIVVPVTVAADAAKADLKLSGKVTLQICDHETCYPPDSLKFTAATSVAGESAPANAELFPVIEPAAAVPAVVPPAVKESPTQPTTAPSGAIAPAASSGPRQPMTFSFFGVSGTVESVPAAFLAAIVAGLLFNVMPCVLPVLPLKAIGFYEASHHSRRRSIVFGLAFSAGVIAIFGGLSLAVVFSRQLFGSQFSWGQQFSSPAFVWAVVVVLVVLGASMLGAFALRLPSSIYGLNFRHDTLTGNAMWGGLTAVLSTPCTAPLFPLVLAFAMAQASPLVGVALVLSVGVGMSLPYLVLSAFPELVRRFPRTGAFSELFRQSLAFPIFGTAAFFAGSLFGSEQLQALLIFGVVVAFGVFLVMRTHQLFAGRLRPVLISSATSLAAVAGTLWLTAPAADTTSAGTAVAAGQLQWTDYSPEALQRSLGEGHPVLIKFTAKWCANCIALEKTVYREQTVIDAIQGRGVVLMKLDVDKVGWDLLNKLAPGAGIPYTAVYVPAKPDPLLLASMHDSGSLVDLLRQTGVTVAGR